MPNGAETNLVRNIMLALGKIKGVRTFRNNCGVAWIGKSKRFTKTTTVTVNAGDVLIQNGRVFHGGLCLGSSDIIGFQSLKVTPEMVGQTVAVFMAVEAKTETGRLSPEQKSFIEMVGSFGGISAAVKNEVDALNLLKK